jgi:hypothetical protein
MSDVNYCLLSISLEIMLDIITTMVSDECKDLDTTRLRLEAIRKEACEAIQRLDKEAEFNE